MLLIDQKWWCMMNYKAILLLLFGIAIIAYPQYVREYKAYEIGKKPTRDFIIIQRITGVIFVIVSIILFVLDIE